MSGKYLLDTCFVIGLQKHQPDVLATIASKKIQLKQCCYSVITRLELLSYPDLNPVDQDVLQRILAAMVCINLDDTVQANTIALRQGRKVKLPDSIVLATAASYGFELLTLDIKMQNIAKELNFY